MSGLNNIREAYSKVYEAKSPSFEVRKSSGAGALTPSAARQLGPKAVELQKKKAAAVKLPKVNSEEVELGEAHWDPVTKTIGSVKRTGSDPEIQKMAKRAAASGPKKRVPLGQGTRNKASSFTPSSREQAKKDKENWDSYWEAMHKKEEFEASKDRMRMILDEAKKEKTLRNTNPCWKGYEPIGTKKKGGKTVPNCVPKEEVELVEKAPPGAKFERMVKHIKKGYSKDGLTDRERAIAYATAWKQYNKKKVDEEYLLEKARGTRPKKTVHAYDVDETLFSHGKKGKPNVKVHVKDSSGKRVKSLSNQEFNTHKLEKGHSYDFGEFQSAKKFKETSSPNKKVIKDIKRKQARGQNVHLITARSKFDKPSEFQGHLKKHGVDVDKSKIHYTGGMKGGDVGEKKVKVANAVAKKSGASKVHMYDDAAKVHKAFEKEKKNVPVSKKIKTHMVAPDKKTGESKVRSYQATK
jgi:hypothetical protein